MAICGVHTSGGEHSSVGQERQCVSDTSLRHVPCRRPCRRCQGRKSPALPVTARKSRDLSPVTSTLPSESTNGFRFSALSSPCPPWVSRCLSRDRKFRRERIPVPSLHETPPTRRALFRRTRGRAACLKRGRLHGGRLPPLTRLWVEDFRRRRRRGISAILYPVPDATISKTADDENSTVVE